MTSFAVVPKTDCPHCCDTSLLAVEEWLFSDAVATIGHCPIAKDPPCCECGDISENWICLGCQQVFCSRFVHGHFQEHCSSNPEHCLAVSLSDMSCWCNKCDSYVKLVDASDACRCIYFSKFGFLPPEGSSIAEQAECLSLEGDSHTEKDYDDDDDDDDDDEHERSQSSSSVLHTASAAQCGDGAGERSDSASGVDPPPLPIVVVYHDACERHSIVEHPEQPLRYGFTMRRLREHYGSAGHARGVFVEAPVVTEEQAVRFHTREHWRGLMELCDEAEKNFSQSKLSPKKAKRLVVSIDCDTKLMHASRAAILHSAGSVVHAVDLVCASPRRATSVFCCVRPPGHHAERARAMGFCYLNGAAIAAKHAQAVYGKRRVAVIDFDVHHGNGTEDGFADPAEEDLFYGSTHEEGNYPGTGIEPELKGDKCTNPLFRRIVDRFLPSGKPSQAVFRTKWREVVEEMLLFGPELIVFSAGFDAHRDDPLGGCGLLEADFEWATRIVYDAAVAINSVHPPPIISVLEGGYNMNALSKSTLAHVRAMEQGYPPAPVAGDEAAVLQRHMASLGLGDAAPGNANSSADGKNTW